MEHSLLEPRLRGVLSGAKNRLEVCGFGVVAAAAQSVSLIARHRPDRVLLIGIAGSYDTKRLPIGSAATFSEVACYGIGIGEGLQFRSASELGWPQFPGDETCCEINDRIELDVVSSDDAQHVGLLVSCCAASGDFQEAQCRKQRFPDAVAEDMEGFGVAMACQLSATPLQILRGISNQVGNRDRDAWQIEAAVSAAADLALQWIRDV